MSCWRMWFISVCLFLLIAGHAWDAYFTDTHFPFSYYGMFRTISTRQPFNRMALQGVTPDGKEVPIMGKTAGVMGYRWYFSLPAMYGNGKDEKAVARAREAMAAFIRYYNEGRKTGDIVGPPITGLRLYRMTWTFDEWARNRHSPERSLVLDVTQSSAAAPTTKPTTAPATTSEDAT